MDRIGFKGTDVDRIRTNGQIRIKVDRMDRIGPNGPNRTEVNKIGLIWTESTK